MMADLVLGFAIAGILMAAEYFLCVKMRSPLWGGIIPCLLLSGTIVVFWIGKIPLTIECLFSFVVLNILFLGSWGSGREKYQKRKQFELEKMKVRDM